MAVARRVVAYVAGPGNDHCQPHRRVAPKGLSMSTARTESVFMERFNQIWAQARRVELTQAACWALLTALAGLALLAAADYWLELSRPTRIASLGLISIASIAVAARLVVCSLRRWQRQATAATIERT